MATVLELTVSYMKIFQDRSSASVQDECAEQFLTSFQQIMGKRQLPEDERESPMIKQPKLLKSTKKDPLHFLDRSLSPKQRSTMVFQPPPPPGVNFTPRYRSYAPAMLPPEGVLQSPYAPQIIPHGRTLIPPSYQDIEYMNSMPMGSGYESATPIHGSSQMTSQASRSGGSQALKQEMMFQDSLPNGMSGNGGGGEYPQQVQPLHVYSHH